jgi:hypothetical protein
MSNPKGKTPSLISGSNGKPLAVTAQRRCECSRCHGSISNGDRCFDIPKLGGAFRSTKRYCKVCFGQILEKSKQDIYELETALENSKVDPEKSIMPVPIQV